MTFHRWLCATSIFFLMTAASHAADTADKALSDFLAAEWNYTMEQNPEYASGLGDHRFDDRWQDVSLAAIRARQAHARDALTRLRAIDRAALSPADQINFDLYAYNLQTDIEGDRFRFYLCPLSQQGGVQTANDVIESLSFRTAKDYENWTARLEKLPAVIEQTTALMREGIRTKILLPKIVMGRVTAQIAKQVVDKPEDSPFFAPFKSYPNAIPDADQPVLTARATKAIAEGVVPAYRAFQQFYEKEYLPACYDGVGIWQIPDGDAAYAYYARQHTTTNLTPEQIHQIGLNEVDRITGEMADLQKRLGFNGSQSEFFNFLRTDPEILLQDAAGASQRLQGPGQDHRPAPTAPVQGAAAPALRRRADPLRHRAGHVHGLLPSRGGRRLARGHVLRQPLQAGDAPQVGNDRARTA